MAGNTPDGEKYRQMARDICQMGEISARWRGIPADGEYWRIAANTGGWREILSDGEEYPPDGERNLADGEKYRADGEDYSRPAGRYSRMTRNTLRWRENTPG